MIYLVFVSGQKGKLNVGGRYDGPVINPIIEYA